MVVISRESGRLARLAMVFLLPLTLGASDSKPVVKTQGFLPFADEPIGYRTSRNLNDQITVLNRQLEIGAAELKYEAEHGYLRSVLHHLGVPISSQTLVFSKTSLQFQHISPKTPRALYFNDNVYVGQVLDSKSLELIAFDAKQGAVFYVLNEQKADKPRFERAQMDCVQCHIAAATRRIPGVMVRSVLTSPSGNPKGGAPVYTMGHETPLEQRWGGWYVTGNAGGHKHIGDPLPGPGVAVETSRFLTGHSDVVAHLVLAHQTQLHNLITELSYRFRLGQHADKQKGQELSEETRQQYESTAEAVLRYLVFSAEVPLAEPVEGSSSFTNDFTALGPKDRRGRSLRDFDLQKRIFRYPCSYLIYSDAFDAIPGPARDFLLKRLFEVLSGRDRHRDFANLAAEDRRSILEVLVDTKPGLPEEWKHFLERTPSSRPTTPAQNPARQ